MDLRPHHLLCIQKFTGHGYDADFTAHMKAIVSALKKNPNTPITLVQGCDVLFQMCPNNQGGRCTSLEKVASMDSAVLSVCSLNDGETSPWMMAALRARKQILETEEFQAVCASCQWFELCRKTEVSYE